MQINVAPKVMKHWEKIKSNIMAYMHVRKLWSDIKRWGTNLPDASLSDSILTRCKLEMIQQQE